MAPGSFSALAGLAALAGTSAFLQPLGLPSTRVAPRAMNALSCSRSYATRMAVSGALIVRTRNRVNGWS